MWLLHLSAYSGQHKVGILHLFAESLLMGFGNGLCVIKRIKSTAYCKGLLFVEGSNYLTALASFMQQFGVEEQSRGIVSQPVLRLPGSRLSLWQGWHRYAGVIVPFHYLECFDLCRMRLSASNMVVLRWKEECLSLSIFSVWPFEVFYSLSYNPMFRTHFRGSLWAQ